MRRASFFTKAVEVNERKPEPAYSYVDVGGELFSAAAVALIDHLSTHRLQEVQQKKILERFFIHFPQFKINQAYLTPSERMSMLINNPRTSELVVCLAYVLRQLTVDELVAHPLAYRRVFDGLDNDAVVDCLRQPATVLSAQALNVLSVVLGLTITLSFKEPGKELRMREVFGDSAHAAQSGLVIQVQNNHYFPRVHNKTDFAYVGRLAVNAPVPANAMPDETRIADIVALIQVDNKVLYQSYEQWCKSLSSMVAAGELTKQNLMALYIEFLPITQEAKDCVPFFSRVEQLNNHVVTNDVIIAPEQYTIDLLIRSLAGWISRQYVEPDQLFDFMENRATKQPVTAA